MTPGLHDQILERLLADESIDSTIANLVDAACEGQGALDAVLAKLQGGDSITRKDVPQARVVNPPGAYLKELRVAGFRGVGPERKLELTAGPGLTLLVGRNGSGKSSLAEALETLLTGESRRWQGRSADWRKGWRNLHLDDAAFVEATFLVEGSAPIVVRRGWKKGVELEDGELRVRCGSERLDGLGALGWVEPLATYRPFRSYSELGTLLSQPSKLFDELKSILGLEEVTAASKRLSGVRLARERRKKGVKADLGALLDRMASLEDPRAVTCRDALSGKKWQLEVAEEVVLGDADTEKPDLVDSLKRLSQLRGPNLEQVQQAVTALRAAFADQRDLAGSSEEQNAELARLLDQAVHFHDSFGGPCPVCGGALAEDWSNEARDRLAQAAARAARVRELNEQLSRCGTELRRLVAPVPASLQKSEALGLPADALNAWKAWCDLPDDHGALCEHAETCSVDLVAALEPLIAQARERLELMESAWRPIARALAAWLEGGRVVTLEADSVRALKKAESWLKVTESALRDERFAPIAERSQQIWSCLRQESNVDLAGVKLEGQGNRRRVALNVTVDGRDGGVAVSVMSQGELNALALSLFLPRMVLPESPFHFVVVDDPVQAMDPHKVDGLARVLEEVARTRQVIVLTHDTRLFEAIRRLRIDATVLEVARRAKSAVELHIAHTPVERHFLDAKRCIRYEDKIGPGMAARTVPGFCRLAIEAACVEAIRRRRLKRGDVHVDVEQAIEKAQGVHALAALAITDDAEQGDQVYAYLNNRHGRWATDAFKAIKEGAHGHYEGSLTELLSRARTISTTLAQQT